LRNHSENLAGWLSVQSVGARTLLKLTFQQVGVVEVKAGDGLVEVLAEAKVGDGLEEALVEVPEEVGEGGLAGEGTGKKTLRTFHSF